MRELIFLSHANPEDNEFTRWIALQLARQGYQVWCDLHKFLGGEDFWVEAEQAIRTGTIKFLYLLSTASNNKKGPHKELKVAEHVAREYNIKNFIVPLLIDNLQHKDININLTTLDTISFYPGRADGLRRLLKRLKEDNIPKADNISNDYVAKWWRNYFDSPGKLSTGQETLYGNWYSIRNLPKQLYFYSLSNLIKDIELRLQQLMFPAILYNDKIVTFAPIGDLDYQLQKLITDTSISEVGEDAQNDSSDFVVLTKMRYFVSRLIKIAWENTLKTRQMGTYSLARREECYYFTKELMKHDKISFIGMDGKKTKRNIVGFATLSNRKKRYWHFGITARPIYAPSTAFAIKPHVLFSFDGKTLWDSVEGMHRARRSQCSDWWNDDWRDRIMATMHYLADSNSNIELRLGTHLYSQASTKPMSFNSPRVYTGPYSVDPEEYANADESDGFDKLDNSPEEGSFE